MKSHILEFQHTINDRGQILVQDKKDSLGIGLQFNTNFTTVVKNQLHRSNNSITASKISPSFQLKEYSK